MAVTHRSSEAVSIGIDAAVVADHVVAVRGEGVREDFRVAPTLAGLAKLTERLSSCALVVAEPTAGTSFPRAAAVTDAGCRIGFVANRDSARLRQAITSKTKTDVVDAEMLASWARALEVNEAPDLAMGQIGLRRALRRRHLGVVAAHGAECRLWALAAWAFPDLWRAGGGHRVAQPVLGRWPHLGALGRAHLDSITDVVAAHSRDAKPWRRAERLRDGARGWLRFWKGRLDVDALAWEVAELCDDIEAADETIARATRHAASCGRSTGPTTCCARSRASARSARRPSGPGGVTPPTCPRPRRPPPSWAWRRPTGTRACPPRRRGRSPRRDRPSCALPSTRRATWPAATTPSWPTTTDGSWSSAATTTSRRPARSPASWPVGRGRCCCQPSRNSLFAEFSCQVIP